MLRSFKFSVYSDVWSFSVLMWEIFTYPYAIPYWDLENVSVKKYICVDKKRLNIPTACPTDIGQLMTMCWKEKPQERPLFQNVVSILNMVANKL